MYQCSFLVYQPSRYRSFIKVEFAVSFAYRLFQVLSALFNFVLSNSAVLHMPENTEVMTDNIR